MKIKELTYDFHERGILLNLLNDEGLSTTSEISPLPGYSKETIGEAIIQVEKLNIVNTSWSKDNLHDLQSLNLYPSVYFGLESALLDLLDPLPKTPCKSYALLMGQDNGEIIRRAKQAVEEGFSEAKVKIGHLSQDEARLLVDQLLKLFRLRIDLNGRWPLKDVLQFFKNDSSDHFSYIEDPVSSPKELEAFPLPFALDDHLRKYPVENFLHLKNFKAIIVKPTLSYPVTPLLNLGKEIVVTSSFEGPVGIRQIERLITRLGLENTLHGLDTLRYVS